MNKAELIKRVNDHNKAIELYNEKIVPVLLKEDGIEITDGTIPADQLIKAMKYSSGRAFYDMARAECHELRAAGYDVKINMQTAELVYDLNSNPI